MDRRSLPLAGRSRRTRKRSPGPLRRTRWRVPRWTRIQAGRRLAERLRDAAAGRPGGAAAAPRRGGIPGAASPGSAASGGRGGQPDRSRTRSEVLVDPQQIDPSGATTLDGWDPSPDGRLLAYQLSSGGDEESTLSVLDVATGAVVDGPIDRTRYSPVAWLADSSGFYYVRRLRADSPFDRRVYLHVLGADPAQRHLRLRRRAATRAPTSGSTSRPTAAGWWCRRRSAPPRETTCGSPI